MRLMMPCMQCAQEASGSNDPLAGIRLYPQYVEVNDSGLYTVACRNGHTTSVVTQQHKHETLFELATFAILDGYYREAVSSFAASLERFYEYIIQIGLNEIGCKQDVIDSSWESVAAQSERQLGAFVFVYTSLFKSTPLMLPRKKAEFRNHVVHKGRVPKRSDAVEYGEATLNVIRSTLNVLRKEYPEAEQNAIFRRLIAVHKERSEAGTPTPSTMSSQTIFSAASNNQTLEEYLAQQEFWHAKILLNKYLESPKCNLKDDLLVASAVASLNAKNS